MTKVAMKTLLIWFFHINEQKFIQIQNDVWNKSLTFQNFQFVAKKNFFAAA